MWTFLPVCSYCLSFYYLPGIVYIKSIYSQADILLYSRALNISSVKKTKCRIRLKGLSFQHNHGLGCVETRLQFLLDLICVWVILIPRAWPPGSSSESLVNLCLFSSEKPLEFYPPIKGLTLAIWSHLRGNLILWLMPSGLQFYHSSTVQMPKCIHCFQCISSAASARSKSDSESSYVQHW